MQLKITRIEKDLPLPQYQTEGAVAFDIYTRVDAVIGPKEIKILPANLIIEIPSGYFLMLAARSSLHKKGLMLANGIGVFDQDFHGPKDEYGLILHNFTDAPVAVARGDRLAQGLVVPIEKVLFQEVEQIKNDSRGGVGSTG